MKVGRILTLWQGFTPWCPQQHHSHVCACLLPDRQPSLYWPPCIKSESLCQVDSRVCTGHDWLAFFAFCKTYCGNILYSTSFKKCWMLLIKLKFITENFLFNCLSRETSVFVLVSMTDRQLHLCWAPCPTDSHICADHDWSPAFVPLWFRSVILILGRIVLLGGI